MDAQTSNSQKVLKGISSQTAVTLALGVMEIVAFSIMSRLLTKEDFGYYAAISAVVSIFACFSDAGIGSAIIQKKDPTKRYINNAFTLSLIFGSVVSLVLFVSSGIVAKTITDDTMTIPLQVMSITLLFNCMNSVNISIMYRRLQFLRVGMINLVSLVVTTVVAVMLAAKGYGYYAIITKAVMSSVLTLCLSTVLAKTRYSLTLDYKIFRQIFDYSGWLMASGLFRNLAHDADKLLMSRLLSVMSLGAYNRPKEFIGRISTQLNSIFDTALFPVLSSIQDNKDKVERAYSQSLYFMNIFAMLLTLGFALNSELLIRIFFGEQWLELKWITMVLSFLMLFNIDGRLADSFLRSLGMTRQQFYFRIIEMAGMLIGVVIGALWNIMGIALSVVIANAVLKLLKILYISYKIRVPLMSTISIILSSWRFTLPMVSICGIAYIFIPNTLLGNICLLALFVIVVALEFLVFPSIIGEQYKQTAYKTIVGKLRKH